MRFRAFPYHGSRCQTPVVWIIQYVGSVSKHQFCHGTALSLYMLGVLCQKTISTRALTET